MLSGNVCHHMRQGLSRGNGGQERDHLYNEESVLQGTGAPLLPIHAERPVRGQGDPEKESPLLLQDKPRTPNPPKVARFTMHIVIWLLC